MYNIICTVLYRITQRAKQSVYVVTIISDPTLIKMLYKYKPYSPEEHFLQTFMWSYLLQEISIIIL